MNFDSILAASGGSLYVIVAFIIAISIIVAIHEYGHYIVGRWCGIHAEVFSLGFGKVLFSRVDKRGTTWQVAALPFGGYVKFLGDANAASVGGTANVDGFAERNTMLGAPLWARSLTVVAGPVANFLLAIAIFAGYLMYEGRPTEDLIVRDLHPLPSQFTADLQPGDQILSIGDIVMGEQGTFDDLPETPTHDYRVLRGGDEITLPGPHPIVPRVSALTPRSAADDAGLRVDDVITAINGNEINAFRDIVKAVVEGEDTPLALTIWRDGEVVMAEMTPRRTDEPQPDGSFVTYWRIGIIGEVFFNSATDPVGPIEALKLGADRLWFTITTSLSALYHIFAGQISTCNLSGPVGIAQASGSMAQQGAQSYVLFLGMISAAVGLLNLLPIPVLDGGHLVFHAYEAVARRKPSDRVVQVFMMGGLAIILSFTLFALLNDVILCP